MLLISLLVFSLVNLAMIILTILQIIKKKGMPVWATNIKGYNSEFKLKKQALYYYFYCFLFSVILGFYNLDLFPISKMINSIGYILFIVLILLTYQLYTLEKKLRK